MIDIINLFLLMINTGLLLVLCGALSKFLNSNAPEQEPKPPQTFVSDIPVPRPPNYGDMALTQRISKDITLVKDE